MIPYLFFFSIPLAMSEQSAVTMEQVIKALQRANAVTTAQGERLNTLEEQRNALAEVLQRANTALTDAQQNVQEADQHTREIMGLIDQQWAIDRKSTRLNSSHRR